MFQRRVPRKINGIFDFFDRAAVLFFGFQVADRNNMT